MTEREIETKLAELDRLLNDPDTRMDPHRVWSLLAELSGKLAPAPPPEAALKRMRLAEG